jgi:hypothetical protein
MGEIIKTGMFVEEPEYDAKNATEEIVADDKVSSDCNSIAFRNVGGTVATLLGMPIEPGEMLSFKHDAWVTDRTIYDLRFTPVNGQQNKVVVVRTTLNRRAR